jgi:hypothetical protein
MKVIALTAGNVDKVEEDLSKDDHFNQQYTYPFYYRKFHSITNHEGTEGE